MRRFFFFVFLVLSCFHLEMTLKWVIRSWEVVDTPGWCCWVENFNTRCDSTRSNKRRIQIIPAAQLYFRRILDKGRRETKTNGPICGRIQHSSRQPPPPPKKKKHNHHQYAFFFSITTPILFYIKLSFTVKVCLLHMMYSSDVGVFVGSKCKEIKSWLYTLFYA